MGVRVEQETEFAGLLSRVLDVRGQTMLNCTVKTTITVLAGPHHEWGACFIRGTMISSSSIWYIVE
jgi:hypothetical protein